ncbi:MAG: hypothetical protein QW081_05200 [Desulfurococcaceae archaeon]
MRTEKMMVNSVELRVLWLASIILLGAVAVASVFAYYPLTLQAVPTAPGVVFELGSNAGQPDIGVGNTITVTIGANKTSASITIHPTYQENYYKDVLRINNTDDNAMNVYIVFTSVSNTLPAGSIVKLFVYEGATKVRELDVTNPALNQPISIGLLGAGRVWQLDVYVYIPEGTVIAGRSYTASAKLVYTPSTETPPANPAGGR